MLDIYQKMRTVSHYNSFFVSAVRHWNSLPRDIVLLDSLSQFKSSLEMHLCICFPVLSR